MNNRLGIPASAPCLAGRLLVAAPSHEDQVLGKSVCLIVHHSDQGAIGVMLNREFQNDAHDLWEDIVGLGKEYQAGLLHLGGPESGPVVAVHNSQKYAEFESGDGVFFAAQVQNLQALLRAESDSNVKILVGQVVWEPGQLEAEFEAGQWGVLPITSKVVFAEDHLMWTQAMREVGNRFVEVAVGSNAPTDILFN